MLAVGVHVCPGRLLLPRCRQCPGSVRVLGGMWDANPRGGTTCLPSSGEQSGWWDKQRNLLDDLKAISWLGFPKRAEVGVLASFWMGWVSPPSAPCCVQPLQPAETRHLNEALQ